MNSFRKYIIYFASMLVTAVIVIFVQRQYTQNLQKTKINLGEQLVRALYDYETIYELDAQMSIVQSLCTEAVYNDLTIDNEERTLTTYLKFKQDSVHVNIEQSYDGYVLYTLNTESVDNSRLFCLYYRVGDTGKIDWVKEVECIEFLDTIY